jgi:carboxypeptidase family protein
MKRIISSLLILMAAGCGITDVDKISLRLEGTVTAQATGQPVAGATIQLVDIAAGFLGSGAMATTTTDSQGHYSLAHSADRHCASLVLGVGISASASSFTTGTADVDACSTSLQRIDFALAPEQNP